MFWGATDLPRDDEQTSGEAVATAPEAAKTTAAARLQGGSADSAAAGAKTQ